MAKGARRWAPIDFLIAFVLPLFIALASAISPLGSGLPAYDSGVFLFGASQILDGKRMYVDFWDHKGPFIYFFDALGLLIGGGNAVGVWILQFLSLVVVAVFSMKAFRAMGGDTPARVATVLALVSVIGVYQGGNYTEDVSLPFMFVALWAFTVLIYDPERMRPVVSGLVQGATLAAPILLRPNLAALWVPMFVCSLIALSGRDRMRFFGSYLAGLLPVIGATVAYLASQGVLPGFVDAVWRYNRLYGAAPPAQILWAAIMTQRGIVLTGVQLLIPLGLIYSSIKAKKRGIQKSREDRLYLWFLLTSTAILFVAVGISGRKYGHYAVAYVPLVAAWGAYTWRQLVETAPQGRFLGLRTQALAAAVVCLLCSLAPVVYNLQRYKVVSSLPADHETLQVVDYIKKNTGPDARVLGWGTGGSINFLARRDPPTKFFYAHVILSHNYLKLEDYVATLRSAPPEIIADVSSYSDLADTLGEGQYRFSKVEKNFEHGFYTSDLTPLRSLVRDLYRPAAVFGDAVVYRLK